MLLRDKIINIENQILAHKEKLRELDKMYNVFLDLRKKCDHTFSAPVRGYEHEGGICVKCGINEVHAACMKIGAKYNG